VSKSGENRKDGSSKKLNTLFYEKDRFHKPGQFIQRKFKDPWHFVHNLFDLLAYTPDLTRVYFAKTISPGFREMIMLTVAGTNDCNL
jgi:hypothetical protein